MNSILRELLFVENPSMERIGEYLNQIAFYFIPLCTFAGVIWEKLTTWDFKGIGKRLILSVLFMSLLTPHIKSSTLGAIELANKVLDKFEVDNKFISGFIRGQKKSQIFREWKTAKMEKWQWDAFRKMIQVWTSDLTSIFIYIFIYIGFFILKHLYSLIFYLHYSFFGLICAINIFPLTKEVLNGSIKTWLWLISMPFVVSVVLLLVGNAQGFNEVGSLTDSLEGLIQMSILAIMLLLAPALTEKLLASSGVVPVAGRIGMVASSILMYKTMDSFKKSGRTIRNAAHEVASLKRPHQPLKFTPPQFKKAQDPYLSGVYQGPVDFKTVYQGKEFQFVKSSAPFQRNSYVSRPNQNSVARKYPHFKRSNTGRSPQKKSPHPKKGTSV